MRRKMFLFGVVFSILALTLPSRAMMLHGSGGDGMEFNAWGDFRVSWSYLDVRGNDEDDSQLQQYRHRGRFWFDFAANENLKAVWGTEIGNMNWGNPSQGGQIGGDGVNQETKALYLEFAPSFLPDLSFRAGLQPLLIPAYYDTNLLDADATAITAEYAFSDKIGLTVGWLRELDATDTPGDQYDTVLAVLPMTFSSLSMTPYALYAYVGGRVDITAGGSFTDEGSAIADNISRALLLVDTLPANAQVRDLNDGTGMDLYWAGANFGLNALDPFNFHADFTYGSTAGAKGSVDADGDGSDDDILKARGYIFDIVANYTGFDRFVPEFAFMFASGENDDVNDGSERMPIVSMDGNIETTTSFGMGNSLFGVDTQFDSVFGTSNTGYPTIGVWALVGKIKELTLLPGLTHNINLVYYRGTNDKDLIDNNIVTRSNPILTTDDAMWEVNFDSFYKLFDQLTLGLELGMITVDYDKDRYTSVEADGVTPSPGAEKLNDDPRYKATLGLRYNF